MTAAFNPGVGIEFERNLSHDDGAYPNDMAAIERMWNGFAEEKEHEGKVKLDVRSNKPTGAEITLSSGNRVTLVNDTGYPEIEFPTTVFDNLLDVQRDLAEVFELVLKRARLASDDPNMVMLATGSHPFLEPNWENYFKYRTPKGQFYTFLCEGIGDNLPGRKWNHFHYLTLTSDQPNIDLPRGKEFEMIQTLNRIMGILVAMSANSPFESGKIASHKSIRQPRQWKLLNRARYSGDYGVVGMPESEPDSLDWYFRKMFAQRPMLFHGADKTGGLCIVFDEDGKTVPSFIDFLGSDRMWEGRTINAGNMIETSTVSPRDEDLKSPVQRISFWNVKPQLNFSGAKPITRAEFLSALQQGRISELFADKGVKVYTEIRSIDSALPGEELRMPALIKGLVVNYPETSNYAFNPQMTYNDWRTIFELAGAHGMDWKYRGKKGYDYCRDLYEIGAAGLKKVNQGAELPLIESIKQDIELQQCPADKLLQAYHSRGWDGVLEKIRIS